MTQVVENMRFGRLTTVVRVGTRGKNPYWLCECDCGTFKGVKANKLRTNQKSCGCFRTENVVRMNTVHGDCRKKKTARLYRTWADMKARCNIKSSTSYKYYGGVGIAVCEAWSEYVPFREWALANGYLDTLEIDRTDPDGDYHPGNCRFVTPFENRSRRRPYVSTHS